MRFKLILPFVLFFTILKSQHTVGLVQYSASNSDGYVLFAPMQGKKTYLIDKCGRIINTWTSTYNAGLAAYLLEDGSLMRSGDLNNANFNAGGSGGIIEKYDWNGNLTWSYSISDSTQCQHHDFRVLPNGNVLVIAWDSHERLEAIQNGRDSSYSTQKFWSEKIVEIKPQGSTGGTNVWEWRLWDHLVQDFDSSMQNFGVVNTHHELADINYFSGPPTSSDWIHLNSIDYHPGFDQILLSSHNMGEIWIIDHSTTTAEARTHSGGNSNSGGDILYRWGNPRTYGRGTIANQEFFGQHHATWIPTGYPDANDILVFNNGLNRTGSMYSSLDKFTSTVDLTGNYPPNPGAALLPAAVNWRYTATPPTDFYAGNISGVYPLLNGGYIFTDGPEGTFYEMDSLDTLVWKYISPVTNTGIISQGATATNNNVFRCNFYLPDYSAFDGRVLTPGVEVELNPTVSLCPPTQLSGFNTDNGLTLFPNPASGRVELLWSENTSQVLPEKIMIYDSKGIYVSSPIPIEKNVGKLNIDISNLPPGIYFVRILSANGIFCFKLKVV